MTFVQSGDFSVLQSGGDVSHHFIFRIVLKPGKRFQRTCLEYRSLPQSGADLMFLKTYKGVLHQMRYLEVRIPHRQNMELMVEDVFTRMQHAIKDLSSPRTAVIAAPQSIHATVDLNTTHAPSILPTDSRRVQGADFGPNFMALVADEKIEAIDKKIRAHVKDEQQLKECIEMIKDLKRAVELDDAVGPLGNGNVASQICRIVKEDVPHEMLDLFLMMGRLRVQKRKEATNKKRRWDIASF